MKRLPRILSAVLIALTTLSAASAVNAATYYVATTGKDTNPGTQASPFQTIQHGIDAAADGDTVQVAAGAYAEHITWSGKSLNVQGAGASQSRIDGSGNGTCLSLSGVPGSARLSGFLIQGGNPTPPKVGGGVYLSSSSPTIANCTLNGNQAGEGGGMFSDRGSSPTVANCAFTNNAVPYNGARPGGGAICIGPKGSVYVVNCIFTGNSDGQGDCGGISSLGGDATVTSCLLANNAGAAIAATAFGKVTVTNCTLTGNGTGVKVLNAGADNYGTSVSVFNSILWGDGRETYVDVSGNGGLAMANSDVGEGIARGIPDALGNINVDPRFAAGYRLQSTSPCINMGDASWPGLSATDLDGAPRILGGAPDMGAYEFWSSAYGQWCVDKALGDDATGNGSPTAPYKTVVKAITVASNGHQIYIKQGNYGTDKPRITKSLKLFNWGNTGLARIGKP